MPQYLFAPLLSPVPPYQTPNLADARPALARCCDSPEEPVWHLILMRCKVHVHCATQFHWKMIHRRALGAPDPARGDKSDNLTCKKI